MDTFKEKIREIISEAPPKPKKADNEKNMKKLMLIRDGINMWRGELDKLDLGFMAVLSKRDVDSLHKSLRSLESKFTKLIKKH